MDDESERRFGNPLSWEEQIEKTLDNIEDQLKGIAAQQTTNVESLRTIIGFLMLANLLLGLMLWRHW